MMKNERDPIVDEIHQTRQAIAEKFNGDIAEILKDARQRQTAEGRPVWHPHATGDARMQAAGDDAQAKS